MTTHDRTKDTGLYGLLREEGQPNHAFDAEGKCIRCGADAESWDLGCVEESVADLEQALALLEKHEWEGSDPGTGGWCPACGRNVSGGHLPDCTWANLLSKYNREVRFHD